MLSSWRPCIIYFNVRVKVSGLHLFPKWLRMGNLKAITKPNAPDIDLSICCTIYGASVAWDNNKILSQRAWVHWKYLNGYQYLHSHFFTAISWSRNVQTFWNLNYFPTFGATLIYFDLWMGNLKASKTQTKGQRDLTFEYTVELDWLPNICQAQGPNPFPWALTSAIVLGLVM